MQNIKDLRLSRKMKYEALYWALNFYEYQKNVFIKEYLNFVVTIYSEKQYVDFQNKLTVVNGKRLNLTTHKSFVVLEAVIKLLDMGYLPEEIIIDLDNEYDIYAKDLYIKCYEWGHLAKDDLVKFNTDTIKSIRYTSKLSSGLITRKTIIKDYQDNFYTSGIFEHENRQKEYSLYNAKSLKTKDFIIINNKLVNYLGNDKKVIIPEGVKSLASSLFWDNQIIEEVIFPKSLTDIGGDTFYNCFNLKKIYLHKNIQKMGNNPFAGCINLKLVSDSLYFKYGDGALYNNDYSRLIYYEPSNKQRKYYIKEQTKIIGKHAFYLCKNLEEVIIPKSVIKLENNPFSGCTNLSLTNFSSYYHIIDDVIYNKDKTAVIGCLNKIKTNNLKLLNIKRISRNAFWNCQGIDAITLPKTLIEIGYNPFVGCKNIRFINNSENFKVLKGVLYNKDQSKLICYPAYLAKGKITINENVRTLERGAFSGANQLKEINLKNISVISKSCFTNCDSLKRVYCSDLVSFIGEWAFAHCKNLEEVSVFEDTFIDKNTLKNSNANLKIRNKRTNYIIESNNIYTLLTMKNNYQNKIDAIIIDPPYNSKVNYIGYKDNNFKHGYKEFLKKRFKVSKELLSKNGVIAINIDRGGLKDVKKSLQSFFNKIEVFKWEKLHPYFDKNRDVSKNKKRVKYEYIVLAYKGKKQLNNIKQPFIKNNEIFEKETKVPKTFKCFGTTSSAKDEIKEIFGTRSYFSTPKPLKLIKELIRATTDNDSIVLDYFAGSGTTGQATIDLNKEDGGKRNYILVSNSESNICKKVTVKRIKKFTNDFVYL